MARLVFGDEAPVARASPLLHPNGNAYDMAITAWLDARLLVTEYQEYMRRDRDLWGRILNGRVWMQQHNEQHPRYAHNRELLIHLEWDRELNRFQASDRLLAIRVNVWTVWCCSQSMTVTERMTLGWETDLKSLEGPDAIWSKLELDDVEMGRLPVMESATWGRNDKE